MDNDSLTRDGITAIVARQHDMLVLEEIPDGGATGGGVQESQPDVVFVDAGLASDDGGAVIRAMIRSSPNAKIIAFGMGTREEEIFHVLNAGASGYVIRNAIGTELVRAIRSTHAGHRYIPREIQQRLDARKARPQLTPRERDVLTLLAEARSNATIAAVLGIAVGTVKLHVKSVFAKLGVEDRAEAVLVAMERGFTRMAPSSR